MRGVVDLTDVGMDGEISQTLWAMEVPTFGSTWPSEVNDVSNYSQFVGLIL